MKELLRERDMIRINYYRDLIEAQGIATFVRNENIAAIEGYAIPNYLPILCVTDDSMEDQAMEIIREDMKRAKEASTREIPCPSCGEPCPENFRTCWNCGGELRQPTENL